MDNEKEVQGLEITWDKYRTMGRKYRTWDDTGQV